MEALSGAASETWAEGDEDPPGEEVEDSAET
jgi:hypothetical protein